MSESGTPEAILSAEQVTLMQGALLIAAKGDKAARDIAEMLTPILSSHEALRAEVERLTESLRQANQIISDQIGFKAEVERLTRMNETLARNLATAANRNIEQAERLTAEVERLTAERAGDAENIASWQHIANEERARVAELTAALHKHGRHDRGCHFALAMKRPDEVPAGYACVCGFAAVVGGTDTPCDCGMDGGPVVGCTKHRGGTDTP